MTTATKDRSKAKALTFEAGELLDALTAVSRAISHGPKPIVQNVRIGDGLITATDLEVRIDREIGQQCEAFLLPAARLTQILKSVPKDADVAITPNGTSVTIKAGGGRWEIPTEDAAEFPHWEPADLKPLARFPADQFVRAVRATVYATDNESSRFALGAVLCDVKDGNPTFVGTDGRRLSAVETETDQAVDNSTTLIPSRAIRLMAALAGSGSVQLEANKSEVVCTTDGATITARLVEGRFPKWADVFPDRDVQASVLAVRDLEAAVKAAAVCTSEQSKGVAFSFGETLRLASQSAEAGQAAVTCEVLTAGQAATVKLDPRFVLDFLAGLDADDEPGVEIEAAGPGDAVVLRCGDVRGVIMPLAEDA